jgi:hypothetical protein
MYSAVTVCERRSRNRPAADEGRRGLRPQFTIATLVIITIIMMALLDHDAIVVGMGPITLNHFNEPGVAFLLGILCGLSQVQVIKLIRDLFERAPQQQAASTRTRVLLSIPKEMLLLPYEGAPWSGERVSHTVSISRLLRHVTVEVRRAVVPPHRTALVERRLTSSAAPVRGCFRLAVGHFLASRTVRRAAISRPTRSARSTLRRSGFAMRQSLPRTTKVRPSGVTGCFTIR